MASYNSAYTGAQVDSAVGKALAMPEFKGEVANYAALPAAGNAGDTWLVLNGTGVWPFNRNPAGFYRDDGASWVHMGWDIASLQTDSNWAIRDNTDNTKLMQFELSSITTGNTRTLTVQDKDYTIADKDAIETWENRQGTVGTVNGGTVSDGGSGTIDITAWDGYLRTSDNDTADLEYLSISASTGFSLTDSALNFIYAEYNGGSPQFAAYLTPQRTDRTKTVLGSVYRSGTTLYITDGDWDAGNVGATYGTKDALVYGILKESGAVVTESGTRSLSVTLGRFWISLQEYTTTAKDTNVSDSWTYFYEDGASGWTSVASQTQIDNTQYDDGSGTLATLGNNQYGVHWVYAGLSDELFVVYGKDSYSLAGAEEAAAPTIVPPQFTFHAKLIARVIIQKNASSIELISAPLDTIFGFADASDHGALSGLGDDDHVQYVLADGTRSMTTLNVTNNITVGGTVDGRDVATDGTKLDTIDTNADVTDATNVNAAGATMNTDTNVSGNSWVLDEDDMTSDDATKVPTQQSVKAYVDANAGGGNLTTKGDLEVYTTTQTRLAVGTDDQVLTADSSASAGVSWQTLSNSSGPSELGIAVDAGAMVARTTNGAESATEEYATNDIMADHFLFDGATEEGVQFKTQLPEDYNGGAVTVKFFWDAATGASASDGVTWGVALRTVEDNDAIDQAFPASVDTDDTVIAVGDMHVTASSSDVTISGTPNAGDTIWGEITRVVGDSNDTMTEDAKLFGILIEYDSLAASDTYTEVSLGAGHFAPYATNGAEAGTTVYTNNEFDHFAFDAATEESVYVQFELPQDYKDGSVIRWGVNWDAVATASGTAVFGLSGGAFGNDEALSTALGTERTVTDTLLAVGDRHRSPNDTTGITLAGSPIAGDWVQLKLVVKTSGTIAVDVLFLGLQLQFERSGVQATAFA